MLHEVLYKRKPFLGSFSEGLQVLGVRVMIRHFPDVFKPAFVFSGQVTPADVLKILQSRPDEGEMSENIKRVWEYVQSFVEAADSDGNVYIIVQSCLMHIFLELMAFLQFIITGAPVPVGQIFVTFDDNEAISVNTCGRQLILSTFTLWKKICSLLLLKL